MIYINQISDDNIKQQITKRILENLVQWFEISESREVYIKQSIGKDYFCAYDEKYPIGFLYLKETGKDTTELAVMGILKEYQRLGIGKQLFEYAKKFATQKGYSFIQVKTVQMGKYENYDRTNKFYISLGFKEFEVFKNLWGENNPCQICL